MSYWSTKPLPPWVSTPPAEDLALGGVVDGAIDEPVAVADGLGREQDVLCVPAVDDVMEPAVDLADYAGGRDTHVVVVHQVGG
jgi:hypothetical protein